MNAIAYAQKACELYSVPGTPNQIRTLMQREDSTMQDIADVVMGDPGLVAHLLKYANSPIFRFERKIESLDKAIQVIGVKAVYEFSLVFSMANMLSEEHKRYINVEKFWQQSILCGLYAVHFAKKCREKDVTRLFTCGLLHNVGELAVLRVSPTLLKDCARFSSEFMPREIQEEVLGFSYAEISASLLQRWLIPDSLVSTVAMQHHDESPAITIELQIMQLSYGLSLVTTYPEIYNVDLHLPKFLFNSLNLDIGDIDIAQRECGPEYSKLASLFNSVGSQAA